MKRPDDPKRIGDLPGSLRVALFILEFLTPADFREPFFGDLLEEWQTRIVPEFGEDHARRWLWGQILHSVIPILEFRIRELMKIARSHRPLAGLIRLFLVLYLLPGLLVGLLLYGIAVVLRGAMGATGWASFSQISPPRRITWWIIRLVVPRDDRDEFIGDLIEEYEIIREAIGTGGANRWYRQQVFRSIMPWLRWRLERIGTSLCSERFLERSVHIALAVYIIPAVVMVAAVCVFGIFMCMFIDFMSRWLPTKGLSSRIAALVRFIDEKMKFWSELLGSSRFPHPPRGLGREPGVSAGGAAARP